MKVFTRRALGLETAVTISSAESPESDVIGVDVAELFGEVDKEGHHAPNVDNSEQKIAIIEADMVTVQKIVDVLKKTGDEGATPVALAVAQENLQAIFARHGIKPGVNFAKEAVSKGQGAVTKEAIAYAQESMVTMAREGVVQGAKNLLERMKVNTQHAFRRRTTWRKEAMRLQKQLGSARGAPKAGAQYTNNIRIAYMTLGDQTVLHDGNAMHKNILQTQESLTGCGKFLEGLHSLYSWFNSEKGKVDFDEIAKAFPPSKFSRGMLSVTGPQALFGEETVISDFGGVSNTAEEMMAIMKTIKIQHVNVWKVKDLDIQPLAPLSINEMKNSIGAFVKIGDEIADLYNRLDREFVDYLVEHINQQSGDNVMDFVTSPIRFLRFQRTYQRLLSQVLAAIEHMFEINFKAATCMLGYYEWSLENNE